MMGLIGVVSAKGAPGVSTVAMELVRRWPNEVLGVELDVSGGSWALRHELSWDPGLVSFAATPGPLSIDSALAHGARAGRHGVVICASPYGDQVRASLGLLNERLVAWPDDLDAVFDVGRYDPAVLSLLARCSLCLVVTRGRAEDVGPLQRLADTLRRAHVHACVVLVGSDAYSVLDVAEVVGLGAVDLCVPFTGNRKAYDRAFDALSDTVASHVAHSSVGPATLEAFAVSLGDRGGR